VAVVREGIETVFFLTAAAFTATPGETLLGGAVGLIVAVVLGWLMLAAGKRLDVRALFRVTGILLILFSAGLVAYGVHELQEAALLPTFVEHVWETDYQSQTYCFCAPGCKAAFERDLEKYLKAAKGGEGHHHRH